MSSIVVPGELAISVEGACEISLECWRIGQLAGLQKDSTDGARLRHATRRITETLNAMGIEIIDFAGRIYDPGLVPEVVEVRRDETLPDGHAIIEETIAPTVTWHGRVVKPGQIVVRRSPVETAEGSEVVA
jgi:hypothetical protein